MHLLAESRPRHCTEALLPSMTVTKIFPHRMSEFCMLKNMRHISTWQRMLHAGAWHELLWMRR